MDAGIFRNYRCDYLLNDMKTERRKANVVIVGGGASGLAAAVELGMSSPDLLVLVIEKMAEPGRKIRATGSGRCNITNTTAAGFSRIMEFFTRIGLVTRAYENGLVYPYSESAADVAELLIARAKSLGVDFCCGEEVVSIKKSEGEDVSINKVEEAAVSSRFVIESVYKDEKGEHRVITEADYVVLATGGKAGPTYGTTGDGYRLARELGHSVVTPVPVLTGIECREWEDGAVSLGGTRMQGIVSLYKKGADEPPIFQEAGEVQFTKYGLSGICVFNMTRCMRLDRDKGESLEDFIVRVNLFPEGNFSDYIYALRKGEFSELPAGESLRTVLKESLADYVAGRIDKDKPVSMLDEEGIQSICNMVHNMEFHPVRLRGWKDAQATSGGVSLDEIDEKTSESKLVPGLYITGELADKDFQCGGFNLSNAWLTGLAAADDISGKC